MGRNPIGPFFIGFHKFQGLGVGFDLALLILFQLLQFSQGPRISRILEDIVKFLLQRSRF